MMAVTVIIGDDNHCIHTFQVAVTNFWKPYILNIICLEPREQDQSDGPLGSNKDFELLSNLLNNNNNNENQQQ